MANETQRLWEILNERLTATRAGYLDELDFDLDARLGTPADTNLATDIANVKTVVDSISGLVDSAEAVGPYTYLDDGGEQDVYEDTATTRRKIFIELDLNAMTKDGTIRVKRKVDGTNYRTWIEHSYSAAGNEKVWTVTGAVTNQAFKITYEESEDEGANRDIEYNVITQVIE